MKILWGILLAMFFLPTSVYALDKVRIGFPDRAAQFIPLPLGEQRGFFREEGLQGEFIRIAPTVAVAALVSGEIDYYTSIGSGVAATVRGLPVRVIACYLPSAPIALIARPEFKSVRELKGKTIGINTYGSPLEVIGRLIVKHFGIDPDSEVKFLATGVIESRFATMSQGLTAATLGSAPLDFIGKKQGFVVLASAHELFNYPASGLATTLKKIKEKPDEVKRVIKAGIKANRYISQNRAGTIQVIADWLKIDQEMATATYNSVSKAFNDDGSMPEDGLRLVIEEAKRTAKVNREISINEVEDLSILREAQKELGVKGR
jgi:ABC-type nitrate/sulfonate/bicarbonate transport system substrate-binding protein